MITKETQIAESATAKMSVELIGLLRKVNILSSLDDEKLSCLSEVEELHVAEDYAIARQGEVIKHFWILLEGEIRIYQTNPDGQESTLSLAGPGTAFGELPLLANIPSAASLVTTKPSHLMQLTEEQFWDMMTTCPEVRKAILGNMAMRLQGLQKLQVRQEKMASLGTLAAGLMHELNNPGAAAKRAAAQLRDNLLRMHELSIKFSKVTLNDEQKQCMFDLKEHALAAKQPLMMNSLEQSDAEDALVEWMESANVENAWKLAPTLVSIGINAPELECMKHEFPAPVLSDALNYLEAMASSMQLTNTIEESIGRVGDLIHAVKAYAYEGKGTRQEIDINASIHATLVILAHKMREKEIVVDKELAADLPILRSEHVGLNQIWTNLLDNSIDAVGPHGRISVRTWAEQAPADAKRQVPTLCISISDNGSGIPAECQAHIFDPFFTTKEVGVGTGLGLGIVHRIVDQYNGSINFSSNEQGTEFVVRIPAA